MGTLHQLLYYIIAYVGQEKLRVPGKILLCLSLFYLNDINDPVYMTIPLCRLNCQTAVIDSQNSCCSQFCCSNRKDSRTTTEV